MPWSETAQKTLAWRENRWKTLAEVPPGAEGLPYREWLLRPAYEAANRRRNQPRAPLVEPEGSGSHSGSRKSGGRSQKTL